MAGADQELSRTIGNSISATFTKHQVDLNQTVALALYVYFTTVGLLDSQFEYRLKSCNVSKVGNPAQSRDPTLAPPFCPFSF